MCVIELARKVICWAGQISEVAFLLFSISFHLPFLWKIDDNDYNERGGMWIYCSEKGTLDWDCQTTNEALVEGFLKQSWDEYKIMQSFVVVAELIAAASIAVFYICMWFNVKLLNIGLFVAAVVQILIIFSSGIIVQKNFSQAHGQDTEFGWCASLAWLCCCVSVVNGGLTLSNFIAGLLD